MAGRSAPGGRGIPATPSAELSAVNPSILPTMYAAPRGPAPAIPRALDEALGGIPAFDRARSSLDYASAAIANHINTTRPEALELEQWFTIQQIIAVLSRFLDQPAEAAHQVGDLLNQYTRTMTGIARALEIRIELGRHY